MSRVFAAVVVALCALSAAAVTPPWCGVELKARKFLLSATAEVSLDLVPSASADLEPPPEELPELELPERLLRIQVATDLPGGRDTESSAWLDPADARVLQTEKRRHGGSSYWKLRRFGQGGFLRLRAQPGGRSEREQAPAAWTTRERRIESWDGAREGTVTDPFALLILASAAGRGEGAEIVATLYSDGHLVSARFAPVGAELSTDTFELVRADGSVVERRGGPLRTVRVSAATGGVADDEIDLDFLGMKGEVELGVDPELGLPVEIRGRMDGIGKVKVHLRRAVLCSEDG